MWYDAFNRFPEEDIKKIEGFIDQKNAIDLRMYDFLIQAWIDNLYTELESRIDARLKINKWESKTLDMELSWSWVLLTWFKNLVNAILKNRGYDKIYFSTAEWTKLNVTFSIEQTRVRSKVDSILKRREGETRVRYAAFILDKVEECLKWWTDDMTFSLNWYHLNKSDECRIKSILEEFWFSNIQFSREIDDHDMHVSQDLIVTFSR